MPPTSSHSPRPLSGQVALVTGAARRIGRAVALRLAQEGADVVVHFRSSKSEAEELVSEITGLGVRSLAFSADLTRPTEIQALFDRASSQFGRLDILINNASNFLHTEFAGTTESSWDASLDTNLKSVFFCSQAAAPLLRESRGVIINFSDVGGILPWTGYIPHCVSKAGLIMLTKCLAKELAPLVRVNAIAPGTISMSGDPSEWETDFIRRSPLHRTGTPADIVDAVLFLIRSKFSTGQVLVLDGGRTL